MVEQNVDQKRIYNAVRHNFIFNKSKFVYGVDN